MLSVNDELKALKRIEEMRQQQIESMKLENIIKSLSTEAS